MHPNYILAACSKADYELLAPHLVEVDLVLRDSVEEPNEPIDFVYFPHTGLISTVAISDENERVEVSVVGFEGMSGGAVVNGSDRSPLHSFVQMPGTASRIGRHELEEAMAASSALRTLFLRFNQARTVQLAYTALSNARHTIEERLARWLLMCHDRSEGNDMALTHEFLAMMLGVRRAGVTTSLHILEGALIIKATRGLIHIRDRSKMAAIAGDAYGIPESEYLRLFGRPISDADGKVLPLTAPLAG